MDEEGSQFRNQAGQGIVFRSRLLVWRKSWQQIRQCRLRTVKNSLCSLANTARNQVEAALDNLETRNAAGAAPAAALSLSKLQAALLLVNPTVRRCWLLRASEEK
jgi:hypothetical protein